MATTVMDSPTTVKLTAMMNAYSKFSFQQQPSVFLTLTVKEPKLNTNTRTTDWRVTDATLLEKANLLLMWVNSELFGRKHKKHGKGLSGFGSLEYQANNQPHLHLLSTNQINPKQFLKLRTVIHDKVKKIGLFDESGVDVRGHGGASDTDF